MPRFDYVCPVCNLKEERSSYYWEGVLPIEWCSRCRPKVAMDRLPSAPNFVVNGYNAKNGYTK